MSCFWLYFRNGVGCAPSSFKQANIIIIITKHIMGRFERYARKIETQIM